MFGKWFAGEKKTNENSENSDAIISNAIEALNKLTKYYQGIESNSSTPLTIELQSPWQETQIFGGNDKGILGKIILTAPSNRSYLQDHPFIKTLNAMNIRVDTNSSDGKSYCGTYTLFDLPSIALIPKKCQKYIGKELEQTQEFRL